MNESPQECVRVCVGVEVSLHWYGGHTRTVKERKSEGEKDVCKEWSTKTKPMWSACLNFLPHKNGV